MMNLFEEVKDRLTMREVAERYGHTPNRKGYICCPFHDEKTPSCKLDDAKGTFYCFGCGAHGDVITFVQLLKGYSPLEAAKELAALTGIPVTENDWKPAVKPLATPETVTANQMRRHLQQWQQQTFRELLAIRNELDDQLRNYHPEEEDARFFVALAVRTEIETILDELAAPDEYTLIELFERKGRELNGFIERHRNAISERREPQKGNG